MATCSASQLLEDSACFDCLSNKQLQQVIVQLLCDIQSSASMATGQIKTYASDPNSEAVVPDDVNSPAIAYSQDGSGSIYGWNTTSGTWV